MAVSRALSTRLSEDGDVAALSHEAFRLFVTAITLADDHGNLSADANFLGARAFWQRPPRTPVAEIISEIETAGLWSIYVDRGRSYAHLRGWGKNQKLKIPGKPAHPLPPGWAVTTKSFGKGLAYISVGPDGEVSSTFTNGDDGQVTNVTMGEFPSSPSVRHDRQAAAVTYSTSTSSSPSDSSSGEVQEGAEPTRADLVAVEMTRRADLFPGTDPRDLDAWARGLLRDPDLHLPPKAQLAPYLRAALRKLAGKVAATPGMVNGSRFSFVHTVTFGMVNDDKINHWASGKTDGKEGVCAPPRSQRQQATGSSELDASDADAEIAEADRKLAADRAKQAAEPKVDPAKMAELTRKVLARFGGGA